MNVEPKHDLPWDLVGPATGGLAIGIVLQGTYRIIRPLAEGGCGEVYLAAHTRLPGRFAVKLLHRSLVRDSDALSRFRQEAEITSSLRHPHIVQVFDFNVTDNGVPFLVMELLEGKLLSERVAGGRRARSDAGDSTSSTRSPAALHAAHARGIVHRDLKPENVMLLSAARASTTSSRCSTSASRRPSWRPRLTEGERVAGTPQYMAPEQAEGLREQIDHRSDQFSLAAIAYTLLTGQEPFRGENPIAVLYEVVHTDPTLAVGAGAGAGPGDRRRGDARARPRSRPIATRTCSRSPARCAPRSGGDARAVRGSRSASRRRCGSQTPAPILVSRRRRSARAAAPEADRRASRSIRRPLCGGRRRARHRRLIRRMRWRMHEDAAAGRAADAGRRRRVRLVLARDARADADGLASRGHPDAHHDRAGSSQPRSPSLRERAPMARKQKDIRIGDLRTRTMPAIPEHLSMAAARKVAALKQVEVLFVERDGRLVGALEESVLAKAPDDATVAASMTAIGACLHPEMPASRARDVFAWLRVSMLPVAVGVLLIGAIARGDVERALAQPDAQPDAAIPARADAG